MQDKQMVERQAERAGLGKVTTVYSGMGTPTAISDALLSGNVDIVGIGLPAFLTLWDKTRGNMDVRGMMAMNRQPAYLNTRNPNIKSIRDFTDNDRIALPAPKVSVQAIMLQMIAEKTLGKFDALDKLTVGMSHPDGTAAMLSGKLEISSHFTSAPFQYQQLEGVRRSASCCRPMTRPTGRTRSARSRRSAAGASQSEALPSGLRRDPGGERLHRQESARGGGDFHPNREHEAAGRIRAEADRRSGVFLCAGAGERAQDLQLHEQGRRAEDHAGDLAGFVFPEAMA
jgi:hypothetical protein